MARSKDKAFKDALPHLDEAGAARMVDVGAKDVTQRVAVAEAFVRLRPDTLDLLEEAALTKGDALAVARIAGIAGSKRVPDLIPLAHPLNLTHVAVDVQPDQRGVRIEARVETRGSTGVELEALTAAAIAALSLYDMIKKHERDAVIERIQLLMKAGGRSGTYRRKERKGDTEPESAPRTVTKPIKTRITKRVSKPKAPAKKKSKRKARAKK